MVALPSLCSLVLLMGSAGGARHRFEEVFAQQKGSLYSDKVSLPAPAANFAALEAYAEGVGAKDVEAGRFLHLHFILMASDNPERQDEYCVSLRRNVDNSAVHYIYLYTPLSRSEAEHLLKDTCRFSDLSRIKLSTGHEVEKLTYRLLLAGASAAAAPLNLQVVLNGDIVVGDWHHIQSCLGSVHEDKVAFHLSRSEPEKCFPSLDGKPRNQTSWSAPDKATYKNLCHTKWAGSSKDALAFNVPMAERVLQQLDHAPNRLGAENAVACELRKGGWRLENPCGDLPVWHNHCSDVRNYGKDRMDLSARACQIADGLVKRSSLSSHYCGSDLKALAMSIWTTVFG